jgi:uncharacterized membrane protein YhhN
MFSEEQYIIYGLFTIAFITNLIAEIRNSEILRYYSKPLLIPMIAAFYMIMNRETDYFILAALLFAFVGDIFLMFTESNVTFRAGVISFLLGHIAFIHAFIRSIDVFSLSFNDFLWPLIPAFLPTVVGYAVLLKYFGKFKYLAAVYMVTGSLLLYAALLRFGFAPAYKVWLTLGGTFFFCVSDFFIALTRFKKDFRYSGVLIMVTYILAELGIILGMMVPLI